MPDNSDFFDAIQGAAVFKHKLLSSYIGGFIGKTGSRSAGRVAYLDGYAGPGVYDDGSPGTPTIALEVAQKLSEKRTVELHLVEEDPEHAATLREGLGHQEGVNVYEGRVENHIGAVMQATILQPLLAFLDPYGLTLPAAQIRELLLQRERRGEGKCDVIFNFSIQGLIRCAGKLDKHYEQASSQKGADSTIARLDDFLGGEWWQEEYRAGGDWPDRVVRSYLRRLAGPGWSWWATPVADRYGGPVEYLLVLLTRHPDGMWLFNDGISLAQEALQEHGLQGQMTLMSPKQRDADIADRLYPIVTGLLQQGTVDVGRVGIKVYGELAGEAREKHLRAVLTRLHSQALTTFNPKGVKSLNRAVITPAS